MNNIALRRESGEHRLWSKVKQITDFTDQLSGEPVLTILLLK